MSNSPKLPIPNRFVCNTRAIRTYVPWSSGSSMFQHPLYRSSRNSQVLRARAVKNQYRQLPRARFQRAREAFRPASPAHGKARLSVALMVAMADHIDYNGAGQNEHIVLASVDVHAVGVGKGEPTFRHLSHCLAGASERVFHVEKTTFGLEIVGAGYVHGKLAAKQREQMLFYHGRKCAIARDLVSRSPGQ